MGSSPPLTTAVALLLLICAFHCGPAAGRLLAADASPAHRENGGVKQDAADGLLVVLPKGGSAAGNGGDELSISEMMGAEVEEVEACEEGNDECAQRRLLRDAHLDYIYTQHKGKP